MKNKTEQDIAKNLIHTLPDYVNSPKHSNSLEKLLDGNPGGVSDSVICRVLCISQEDLQLLYSSAILKLRKALGVSEDDI